VRAALPVDAVEANETEERLVDQLRGAERVVGALVAHAASRHLPKLVVHLRE